MYIVHMYVCMYVRTYVCMYVCTYVCMYVCMYVHVYIMSCILTTNIIITKFNTSACSYYSLKHNYITSSAYLHGL